MIVALPRPALGRAGIADPGDQRDYVRSLEQESGALRSALGARGIRLSDVVTFTRTFNGFAATVRTSDLADLPSLGVRAQPVRRFYPASSEPARVPALRSPVAAAPLGGASVAVLDSGVDPGHPLLSGRLDPGYDAVDGDDDPAPERDPRGGRRETSGTALAGILVAAGERVLPIRVAGLQPAIQGAGLEDVAISDQLLAGLERAVDPDGDGATDDHVPVAVVGVNSPYAALRALAGGARRPRRGRPRHARRRARRRGGRRRRPARHRRLAGRRAGGARGRGARGAGRASRTSSSGSAAPTRAAPRCSPASRRPTGCGRRGRSRRPIRPSCSPAARGACAGGSPSSVPATSPSRARPRRPPRAPARSCWPTRATGPCRRSRRAGSPRPCSVSPARPRRPCSTRSPVPRSRSGRRAGPPTDRGAAGGRGGRRRARRGRRGALDRRALAVLQPRPRGGRRRRAGARRGGRRADRRPRQRVRRRRRQRGRRGADRDRGGAARARAARRPAARAARGARRRGRRPIRGCPSAAPAPARCAARRRPPAVSARTTPRAPLRSLPRDEACVRVVLQQPGRVRRDARRSRSCSTAAPAPTLARQRVTIPPGSAPRGRDRRRRRRSRRPRVRVASWPARRTAASCSRTRSRSPPRRPSRPRSARCAVQRDGDRVTGVRFPLGAFERGDPLAGGARVALTERLALDARRARAPARSCAASRRPAARASCCPPSTPTRCPAGALRALRRGSYAFRAVARSPRGGEPATARSEPFER